MRLMTLVCLAVLAAMLPLASAHAKTAHASKPHALPPQVEPQLIPDLPPLFTSYDVYVGGIHLVEAQIWFLESGNVYRTIVKAKTHGWIGRLFPWNTILDAHGTIRGDRLHPQEFFTRDDWNHKPKITKLHFDIKGDVSPEFDPPSHDENREIVTAEQRIGPLDPVTALLQMLAHVAVQKSCAIPVPVFDGKRRFDIIGRDGGMEKTESDDYGVYSGMARVCDADFKMISGEWKDREHARFWKKSETEAGREPFHIWLASPAPGLPEIPVRLESGSIGGLVVLHLTGWHTVSGAELAAFDPTEANKP